jgi:protochlorophyllide reductase
MTPSWTAADIPDLTGRRAAVTGANAGLGYQAALALAAAGAEVVLACRNAPKAEAAAAGIRQAVPSSTVSVGSLDLADLASVRTFAEEVAAGYDRLDLLINNAGLMAVDESRTVDGFETQLGVNHLGHFALTARLLPLLLATPGSRVATMSSLGHRAGRLDLSDLMFDRRGYRRWPAYFQSKLANLLFTAELHRRLTDAGSSTVAVAAHPGGSRTDLGQEGGGVGNRLLRPVVPVLAQSAADGALPILQAATDPTVRGGQFYGPRWLGRGPSTLETPSRRARDGAAARALWDASVELTGLTPPV